MSLPDVPTLLFRPTRTERIGGLLALVFAVGILTLAAAGSDGGDPPDLGVGRKGWSGPVR